MAPTQHLGWLQDNRDWFAELPTSALSVDVPACPGWTVENVVTHLAFGLGLSYPYALAADPNCPDRHAFDAVPWPTAMPVGDAALGAFRSEMDRCIKLLRSTDPALPCYTYQGPGVAAFWFRRAAIETSLHRLDVAEALARPGPEMRRERTFDAIAEAVEFALPLAARWTQTTLPSILIESDDGEGDPLLVGTGEPAATMRGRGVDVLLALWGRSGAGITVDGDADVAAAWMTLVETAFAGR